MSKRPVKGTSSKSRFLHVSGRTIFVSGQASQRVHVCDFTHACPDGSFTCPDRPHFKTPTSPFQVISLFLSLSLGFWDKALDPSTLKLPNSNTTPEMWSMLQDLCFYRLVWGKSENSSPSRFCVDFWEFEFNLSIFSRFCVFWSIISNLQALGCILVRNQGKTQNLVFV
jgi:hypothetical protein